MSAVRPPKNETFVLHGSGVDVLSAGHEKPRFQSPIEHISGSEDVIERARRGLPAGAGGHEAVAVRLWRLGARLTWSESSPAIPPRVLVRRFREWGVGSVAVLRRDPELLPELALGGWFESALAVRAARRAGAAATRATAVLRNTPYVLGLAADLAFWGGVASATTPDEWSLLTRGYTALLYHRLAGELKPGQERVDVPPQKFDGQMRLLRRLGFETLAAAELADVHARRQPVPRRTAVVTLDDAFADAVEPVLRHASLHPLVFVPTAEPGLPVPWLGGEEVASWEQLRELADAGVDLGGHTRSHVDLVAADDATAEVEIRGSRDDLSERLGITSLAFAYPHGRHGSRERILTRTTGYSFAFTTSTGRNGVGTDAFALRRVSVKAWDSRLSFAFKLFTGEQPPAPWERWLLLRAAIAGRLGQALHFGRARARAADPPDAARQSRREP
jgi:peptidoglycan/xylan/chitin deacetylase (PgdA/CDA1 family)